MTTDPRFVNMFVTVPEVKVTQVRPLGGKHRLLSLGWVEARFMPNGRICVLKAGLVSKQVPEAIRRAGSQADKILLNPHERRQIMVLERWVGT